MRLGRLDRTGIGDNDSTGDQSCDLYLHQEASTVVFWLAGVPTVVCWGSAPESSGSRETESAMVRSRRGSRATSK